MRKRSRCPWAPPGEKRANEDDPDGVAGVAGVAGWRFGAGGVGVGAAVKQQTLSEPPLHAPATTGAARLTETARVNTNARRQTYPRRQSPCTASGRRRFRSCRSSTWRRSHRGVEATRPSTYETTRTLYGSSAPRSPVGPSCHTTELHGLRQGACRELADRETMYAELNVQAIG